MSWTLIAMLLLPLVGGLVVVLLRGDDRLAKLAALAFSLGELVLAGLAWAAYEPGGDRLQLTSSVEWIPNFGVHLSFGVDGIALVMIALIAFLVPVVIGGSWADKLPEGRTAGGFFALLLVMEAGMVGVFAATDVFLFYVFFEGVLVPMYFLIGRFGGANRQYAAMKFFLYSLLGGLVMLASVIGLYVTSAQTLGKGTFDWATLVTATREAPLSTQIWLFLGFFVAFAIKAPLVPLHTWLPDAGAEAPVGAGVLLVGVLDKIGTFGFLRYCLPLFPAASKELAPLVLVLAVVGIVYGSLLAVGQSDMKRFVAYTSIAHFGFIALGIFAFSSQAGAGSVLYMVNHGISTGMVFLVVGMVMARGGSRLIEDYGGMAKLTPVLAGLFFIAGLSSLALPGTSSFVSEFLVLIGSFPNEPVYTVIAALGMVLAALYILWLYQRIFQGPVRGTALIGATGGPGATTDPERASVPDLNKREIAVLAPMVALILVLGFYPKPVLDVITPSVGATLSEVGVADPVAQEGK
ncbi:NADH-quinone oxidoreductase subunit M [Actinosynnema mirum]|uniref:Proton-translocating NADH-quinone oxidoreductase, chain M n=1 Tax=Actinosynnema mirum (strain ATCC 29888 / DSM 43827 / JCM 3225 / NBRC 14064 / NCIMB 13271 / NRRL B-12336 / IMRU 3971 / 101) TaxID=446462 RepID=C6WNA3_ACTMD|nr:NADH-quinone oxidoreductase subunit M [Actinosynnema mirum]ACU40467.1 proton-translocating NADH-quinone oxidoreductase, chain M [Actinosynnema mirum DSM 43827]